MKSISIFSLVFSMLLLSSAGIVKAQINTPRPSPGSTVTQKVGLADVSVNYSRPSMKGRKVFGDVVPFDKIWRTGANEPTKISFSDTVSVEGKKLAPGEYAFYTIPGMTDWTIIFGKNPKISAGDYKDDQEAARFTVKSEKGCADVETFTIDFTNLTTNTALLQLSWEKTIVKIKIENEVDSKVMAQIKQKMEDTQVYFQAASYYYDTNRDMKQALEWVNKATEKDPKFYMLHLKAKIQVKLKDCKGAIETAQKSNELAKIAKNDEYVKFNEKLIADCKGK
jgi:hypothetical protein